MPGWGIAADLTPPELVASRRLHKLRKAIVVCLVLVVLLCVAGYAWAFLRHSSASSDLDAANARTAQLTAQQARYAGVTQIQSTTAGVQSKVAALMKDDVDVPKLLADLRAALPATMAIKQLSLTLTPESAHAVTGAVVPLPSAHATIGKITMSGSGRAFDDLSSYVEKLAAIPGVTNVLPGTNVADAAGTQFSLTLDLTDQLYSHRYDTNKAGGK
jgi:Tfp pilus assembly protein PilO